MLCVSVVQVRTILSQNTTDITSQRAYTSLKQAFPNWELVRTAPLGAGVGVGREGVKACEGTVQGGGGPDTLRMGGRHSGAVLRPGEGGQILTLSKSQDCACGTAQRHAGLALWSSTLTRLQPAVDALAPCGHL